MALFTGNLIGRSLAQSLSDRYFISTNLQTADEGSYNPTSTPVPAPVHGEQEHVLTTPPYHGYISSVVNDPSAFYRGIHFSFFNVSTGEFELYNKRSFPAGVITDTVIFYGGVQITTKYHQEVASLTVTSGQGITLSGISAGDVLNPYEERQMGIAFEKEGVASISATVEMTLVGDPNVYYFTITGLRFYLPFMLEANWQDGMEVSRKFLTSVFKGYGTGESRKMLRKVPVRTLKAELSFLSSEASSQAWQFLSSRALGPNVIPFYPDIQRMTQSNDPQRIYIDTAMYRFNPNGIIIAVKYARDGSLLNYDVHRINEVFADSITTSSVIEGSYDAGDIVYPGIVCYPSFGSDTRNNANRVSGRISLVADEMYDQTAIPLENASYSPVISNGLPLFASGINEREGLSYSADAQGGSKDSGRGVEWYIQGGDTSMLFSVLVTCASREEYWDLIGFVNYVRGRGRAFWIPNYVLDISPFNEGLGFIEVSGLDITAWNQLNALWLEDASGAFEVVLVTSVAEIVGGFRINFQVPSISPISYTEALACRLNSDEITEKWFTDAVVEITLPIKELQGA